MGRVAIPPLPLHPLIPHHGDTRRNAHDLRAHDRSYQNDCGVCDVNDSHDAHALYESLRGAHDCGNHLLHRPNAGDLLHECACDYILDVLLVEDAPDWTAPAVPCYTSPDWPAPARLCYLFPDWTAPVVAFCLDSPDWSAPAWP